MANSRRGVLLAVLIGVAAGAGACADDQPIERTPARTEAGKGDDPRSSTSFDRLVALLGAKGTVTMPPLGVEHAANVLDVTVTVHAADEVKAKVSQLIGEISDEYARDPATGTLVDHYDDDMNVLLVSGWNDEAILRHLLAVVATGKRAEVAGLLDGSILHFRIYQTASEITAEEIFVYRPSRHDRALVLRISYAHA